MTAPVTRLWWLRHGPTHERAFLGWRDVPADLADVAAIDRLQRFLPHPAIVVSSDLLRARQTADAIAGPRRRLPDHTGLREFNFGAWDGLGFSEVAERDPETSRAFWETPGAIAPPGGESWDQVSTRVAETVSQICAAHGASDVILVAHMGVIMTQIARCAGQDTPSALGHRIDPLSVTRIDASASGFVLAGVNQQP